MFGYLAPTVRGFIFKAVSGGFWEDNESVLRMKLEQGLQVGLESGME